MQAVHNQFHGADDTTGRLVAVFAPKGVSARRRSPSTSPSPSVSRARTAVLIDGSLQFGDLRALLKVPVDAPSILDLPTDRIQESDLRDVLWRDPSGIDILLAPPRIEMAEMVTHPGRGEGPLAAAPRLPGDRRGHAGGPRRHQPRLPRLGRHDHRDRHLRLDDDPQHRWRSRETFRAIGYPPDKVQYLINRADSAGGMSPDELRRALGRAPEHSVVSDGMLVVQSNNEGVPFVLANPSAPISQDMARVAAAVAGRERAPAAARH